MKNKLYRQTEYLLSAHSTAQFPRDKGAEVAFAGRSNAGKSSVINAITGNKKLARISKTPGRTRQVNFFSVAGDVRLVDLPGYGYAAVSGSLKQQWSKTLSTYLTGRSCLRGLILITDIRRLLTDYDLRMLEWCADHGLPVHILLNKSDKLSYSAAKRSLSQVTNGLHSHPATVQLFSALKKTGLDEVCGRLDEWLLQPKPIKKAAPDC